MQASNIRLQDLSQCESITHQCYELDNTLRAPLSNCIHSLLLDIFFLFGQGCGIRLSDEMNLKNILLHPCIFLPPDSLQHKFKTRYSVFIKPIYVRSVRIENRMTRSTRNQYDQIHLEEQRVNIDSKGINKESVA